MKIDADTVSRWEAFPDFARLLRFQLIVASIAGGLLFSLPAQLYAEFRSSPGENSPITTTASESMQQIQEDLQSGIPPENDSSEFIVKLKKKISKGKKNPFKPSSPDQAKIQGVSIQNFKQLTRPVKRPRSKAATKGLSKADRKKAKLARKRARKRYRKTKKMRARTGIEGMYVIRVSGEIQSTSQLLHLIEQDHRIDYIEPNAKFSTLGEPLEDSSGAWGQSYADLWGTARVQAPAAWLQTRGAGVVVAVIDTGVQVDHPDLAPNIWQNPFEIPGNGKDDDKNGYIDDVYGWDFVNNDNDPSDGSGHGTHCSGTIAAARNGIGIVGVAPEARIMAVKGLYDNGFGGVSSLAAAIFYATDNGADIINSSWGGPLRSQAMEDAFHYADLLGVTAIAAAGNSNDNVENYSPARIDTVISVGATTQDDTKVSVSNWGMIDVSAPGGGYDDELGGGDTDRSNILSTVAAGSLYSQKSNMLVQKDWARMDGTSMAAAHVVGVAALIKSFHRSASPEEIRSRLRFGADNIDANLDPEYRGQMGTGRVNALHSLFIAPQGDVLLLDQTIQGGVVPGAEADLSLTIRAINKAIPNARLQIESNSPLVTILADTVDTATLRISKEREVRGFRFRFSEALTLGDRVALSLTIYADKGGSLVRRYENAIVFSARYHQDISSTNGIKDIPINWLGGDQDLRLFDGSGQGDLHFQVGTNGYHLNKKNAQFESSQSELISNWSFTPGDLDNDGDLDLVAVDFYGGKTTRLFHVYENRGPATDPEYVNISKELGLSSVDRRARYHLAVIDYNNDGLPDILVPGVNCTLLKNLGNMQFSNVTAFSGIDSCRGGFGATIKAIDFEMDGWTDFMLLSDTHDYSPNDDIPPPGGFQAFRNRGNGRFELVVLDIQGGSSIHTYPINAGTVADFDGNGLPDLFLSNFRRFGLKAHYAEVFLNEGGLRFRRESAQWLASAGGADSLRFGWSTQAYDFDLDGHVDIFSPAMAHGVGPNRLLRNTGNGFEDISLASGAKGGAWNDAAYGDFDGDGDIDIFNLRMLESRINLYENQILQFEPKNWLTVRLHGQASNARGLGAIVEVTSGGHLQRQSVVSTENTMVGQLTFGLGDANVVNNLTVRWPSGAITTQENVPTKQLLDIYEVHRGWHNIACANASDGKGRDVNGDGLISPSDNNAVVNYINRHGAGTLPQPRPLGDKSGHIDVNNDGDVTALDSIIIANWLNRYGETPCQPPA